MKPKKTLAAILASIAVSLFGLTKASAETTIEFIQWWAPRLPAGSFRAIMDDFEAENPGIKVKLVSGPYSATRDQIVVAPRPGAR